MMLGTPRRVRQSDVQIGDKAIKVAILDASADGNALTNSWAPGHDWKTFTPIRTTLPYPLLQSLGSGADVTHYSIPAPTIMLDVTPRYIPGTDIVDPDREAEYQALIAGTNEVILNLNRYNLNLAKGLPTAAAAYEEIMRQSYAWARADALAIQGGDDTTSIISGRMVAVAINYGLCKSAALIRNDTRRHLIEAWIWRRVKEPMLTFTNPKRQQNLQGLAAYYAYAAYIATGDFALKVWALQKWREVVNHIDLLGYHALELLRGQFAEHYHIYTLIGLVALPVLAEANGDASLWGYRGVLSTSTGDDPALLRLAKAVARNLNADYATKEIVDYATGRFGEFGATGASDAGDGHYVQRPYPAGARTVTYPGGDFLTTATFELMWVEALLAAYPGLDAPGAPLGKLRASIDAQRAAGVAFAAQIGYLEPGPLSEIAIGQSYADTVLQPTVVAKGQPMVVTAINGDSSLVGVAVAGDLGGLFTVQANGDYLFAPGVTSSLEPTQGDFRRTAVIFEVQGQSASLAAYVETEPRTPPHYITNGDFSGGYRGWQLQSVKTDPSDGNAEQAGLWIVDDEAHPENNCLRWQQERFVDTSARNRKIPFLQAGVEYTLVFTISRYVSGIISPFWSQHTGLFLHTDPPEKTQTVYSAAGTYTLTFTPSLTSYFGFRARGGIPLDLDINFVSLGDDPLFD